MHRDDGRIGVCGLGTGGATSAEGGRNAAKGTADYLHLAATPTFAIMAILTVLAGVESPLCSSVSASPLTGMAAMYFLMSAFHVPPWLKLISGRRNQTRQC